MNHHFYQFTYISHFRIFPQMSANGRERKILHVDSPDFEDSIRTLLQDDDLIGDDSFCLEEEDIVEDPSEENRGGIQDYEAQVNDSEIDDSENDADYIPEEPSDYDLKKFQE